MDRKQKFEYCCPSWKDESTPKTFCLQLCRFKTCQSEALLASGQSSAYILEMSLETLPCEILSQIVQYLPVDSLLNGLALASTQFYYLVQDELERLKIDMEIDFDTYQTPQTQSLSNFNIGKLVLKNCANPYEFLSEVKWTSFFFCFKNHDLSFF